MSSGRYVATSAREALKQIREELGADATITSHKEINGWHEITASSGIDDPITLKEKFSLETEEKKMKLDRAKGLLEILNGKKSQSDDQFNNHSPQVTPHAPEEADDLNTKNAKNLIADEILILREELREIKDFIQLQINNLTWEFNQQSKLDKFLLSKKLLNLGFSSDLVSRLINKISNNIDIDTAFIQSKEIIAKNIQYSKSDPLLSNEKNIITLLGTTGVGKTTTLAKIAARFTLHNARSDVAFISIDGDNVWDNERLHAYAKKLGIVVLSVKNIADLETTIEVLSDKKLILIDVPSLSLMDQNIPRQLEMLSEINSRVQMILCLSSNSNVNSLNAITTTYSNINLEGCVITKLDEAVTLGAVLTTVIQNQLKVMYVTNGQNITSDIDLFNMDSELEIMLTKNHSSEAKI